MTTFSPRRARLRTLYPNCLTVNRRILSAEIRLSSIPTLLLFSSFTSSLHTAPPMFPPSDRPSSGSSNLPPPPQIQQTELYCPDVFPLSHYAEDKRRSSTLYCPDVLQVLALSPQLQGLNPLQFVVFGLGEVLQVENEESVSTYFTIS